MSKFGHFFLRRIGKTSRQSGREERDYSPNIHDSDMPVTRARSNPRQPENLRLCQTPKVFGESTDSEASG